MTRTDRNARPTAMTPADRLKLSRSLAPAPMAAWRRVLRWVVTRIAGAVGR